MNRPFKEDTYKSKIGGSISTEGKGNFPNSVSSVKNSVELDIRGTYFIGAKDM
jgi:hypothetical protein